MDSSVSESLLAELRSQADESARPKERHGTIDRLVEACDSIMSGAATELIQKFNADAIAPFRKRQVQLRPDRVGEFVYAMRAKDAAERRHPSKWTGPTAVTLRKDKKLLAYLRARADENAAPDDSVHQRTQSRLEALVESVPDISERSSLRLSVARGRQAQLEVNLLRQIIRTLKPELDPSQLGAGNNPQLENPAKRLPSGDAVPESADRVVILGLIAKLTDQIPSVSLSRFNLVYDAGQDRVKQAQLRHELISPQELGALRRIAATACED